MARFKRATFFQRLYAYRMVNAVLLTCDQGVILPTPALALTVLRTASGVVSGV